MAVTRDGFANELQSDKQRELMIDSLISQTRHVEERELEPWIDLIKSKFGICSAVS